MTRLRIALALVAALSLVSADRAFACVSIDLSTGTTTVRPNPADDTKVTIVVTGYTTFGVPAGTTQCVCGLKLPIATEITSVDSARIRRISDGATIIEFTPNATTSSSLSALDLGNWSGLKSALIGVAIQSGEEVQLIFEATKPMAMTPADVTAELNGPSGKAGTDEGNADGSLSGGHTHIVKLQASIIPTLGEWGLIAFGALLLAVMFANLRRSGAFARATVNG